MNEADLENASKLVNSNGGDWGYVTFVITAAERNVKKWNAIFTDLRRLHLIPIVRLATQLVGDHWEAPVTEDAASWSDFLSSLNWVTKNRYVVLFNEPNHAKEWGWRISPEEYADIISSYSSSLKQKSDDFFILPAGLDASAPNGYETMDEIVFLKKMIARNPDIFASLDGWTSHSYPNPGFRGSADGKGRGTLRTYQWELETLAKFGIQRSLPVFITETGWAHREGIPDNSAYLPAQTVAEAFQLASESVWNDPAVIALTPFLLNYQSYPFSYFSWQLPDSSDFYPQFAVYQNISKEQGSPILAPLPSTPTQKPSLHILGLSSRDNSSADVTSRQSAKQFINRILLQFISLPFVSRFISSAI